MNRLVVVLLMSTWVGATLAIGQTRWASRRSLVDRIAPYVPGHPGPRHGVGVLSGASFRDVLAPLAETIGARIARLLGVHEELGVRLERIHASISPPAFRLRQLGAGIATFAIAGLVVFTAAPPPAFALLALLGAPALVFMVIEQRLVSASADWQARLFAELPVVTEQLGMLLSAGFSLGAALDRLTRRGNGCVARDLERVCGRIRQGLTEAEALREWAATAQVDAVDRLVGVLALSRDAPDLGRLVSDEARATRREAHRRQIELIERRGQQVWIPVTVAALVPGVLFLAVPFIEAMRLFGGG